MITPRMWIETHSHLGGYVKWYYRRIYGTWYQFTEYSNDGETVFTVAKLIPGLKWEIVHSLDSPWRSA